MDSSYWLMNGNQFHQVPLSQALNLRCTLIKTQVTYMCSLHEVMEQSLINLALLASTPTQPPATQARPMEVALVQMASQLRGHHSEVLLVLKRILAVPVWSMEFS
jgi:hypothetical protein